MNTDRVSSLNVFHGRREPDTYRYNQPQQISMAAPRLFVYMATSIKTAGHSPDQPRLWQSSVERLTIQTTL